MKKILITISLAFLLVPQLTYAATLREEIDLLHQRVDTTNERVDGVESNVSTLPTLEARFAGLETYAVNSVSNSLDSMRTFTVLALALMIGLLGLAVLFLGLVAYHKILRLLNKRIKQGVEAAVSKRIEAHTVENLKLQAASQFSNKLHEFAVNAEENEDGTISIVPGEDNAKKEGVSERQATLSIFNLSEPLV